MNDDLKQFLHGRHPFAVETVHWGSDMELQQSYYLGDDIPPDSYITSVRAVLLKGDEVLVFRDRMGDYHLLPGGCRDGFLQFGQRFRSLGQVPLPPHHL
jgi:hypothetical protein